MKQESIVPVLFTEQRMVVFSELAECILVEGAYKAIKYLSPKLTVKATRKRFKGKIDKRSKIAEIMFTVGAPNYEERKFIKGAVKMGMAFPLNQITTKFVK
jgi:hypothetical protein